MPTSPPVWPRTPNCFQRWVLPSSGLTPAAVPSEPFPHRGVTGAFPALPSTLDHQLPEASRLFFVASFWLAPGLARDRAVHGDEWEGNFSERQSSEVPSPLGGYLLCALASHTLFSGLSFLFLVNFKEKVDLSKTAHCWLNVNKRYMNRGCRGRESSGNIWSKMTNGGFLGFSVVKNLPGNAGDAGLIPGPGRSHMPLSPRAAVTEPSRPAAGALQHEQPPQREAARHSYRPARACRN